MPVAVARLRLLKSHMTQLKLAACGDKRGRAPRSSSFRGGAGGAFDNFCEALVARQIGLDRWLSGP